MSSMPKSPIQLTPKSRTSRQARPAQRLVPSEVPFFLSLILFLIFTLGSVIIAQKFALRYVTREFPRVAEHNYRALQQNLALVEQRLVRQIVEVRNVCLSSPPPTADVPLPAAQP